MKSAFLKIGVQQVLLQLVQNPSNALQVCHSLAFVVNQDAIKIYDNENVKLIHQDFVDITLNCGGSIGQAKRYYLVLKMVIAGFISCLIFITLSNSHLMSAIG